MMEERKHIATFDGTAWFLYPKLGKIVGVSQVTNEVEREFWVGNPPAHHLMVHKLFTTVCDLAVALGMLRRIATYTTHEPE